MSKKPKFTPEIVRIALNPEQAVLLCACYDTSMQPTGVINRGPGLGIDICSGTKRAYVSRAVCNSARGNSQYVSQADTTTS